MKFFLFFFIIFFLSCSYKKEKSNYFTLTTEIELEEYGNQTPKTPYLILSDISKVQFIDDATVRPKYFVNLKTGEICYVSQEKSCTEEKIGKVVLKKIESNFLSTVSNFPKNSIVKFNKVIDRKNRKKGRINDVFEYKMVEVYIPSIYESKMIFYMTKYDFVPVQKLVELILNELYPTIR